MMSVCLFNSTHERKRQPHNIEQKDGEVREQQNVGRVPPRAMDGHVVAESRTELSKIILKRGSNLLLPHGDRIEVVPVSRHTEHLRHRPRHIACPQGNHTTGTTKK